MKAVIVLFAAFFFTQAYSMTLVDLDNLQLPLQEEEESNFDVLDVQNYGNDPGLPGIRLPRFTCDVLSFSFRGSSFGHSACAAHCVSKRQGYKGGSCKNGVCHCRR